MKSTFPTALAAALLLLALPAPAALDLDKTGGALGGTLEFSLQGDAREAFLLIPSYLGGTTPLRWIDPTDPRVLQVGLDTLYLAAAGALDGTGKAKVPYPLPADNSLHGLRLHWQAFTAPGSTYLVDDLSNKVVSSLGVASCFVALPGKLPFAPALPGAVPLAGNRALVCGGAQGSLLSGKGLKAAAVYDGLAQTWTRVPDMSLERTTAVTVRLQDGRVLVCGGADSSGKVTATTEIYDPKQNRWIAAGNMTVPRAAHAGVLLGNGKVLVCGGVQDLSDLVKAITGAHKSAEIYDPTKGTWSRTGDMKKVRIAHTLTTTGNRVVAAGGLSFTMVIIIPVPEFTTTAEYFDGAKWTSTGGMKQGRAAHSAITLKDGRILVCGGFFSTNIIDPNSYKAINDAELYDPTGNSWSSLPAMKTARGLPALVLRPDGKVLVCGGAQGTYQNPVGLQSCEIYTAGTFAPHGCSLDTARVGVGLVALDDGSILFAGGAGGTASTSLDTAVITFP